MRPQTSRRARMLALMFLAVLTALFVSSGVAYADHQPNHNPPGQTNCGPDPDGDENGGVDRPDCSGDDGTSDGNNGSGNDEDCEDDNNGNGTPGRCVDVCPLINGVQRDPALCAPPVVVDACPNLADVQAAIPAGLVLVDGQCVAPTPPVTPDTPTTPETPTTPTTPPGEAAAPPAASTSCPSGQMLVEGACVVETPSTAPAGPVPSAGPQVPAATPEVTIPTAVAGATDVPTGSTSGAVATPTGALPFTGAPAWLVALMGSTLVLLGAIIHVHAARRTPARTAA